MAINPAFSKVNVKPKVNNLSPKMMPTIAPEKPKTKPKITDTFNPNDPFWTPHKEPTPDTQPERPAPTPPPAPTPEPDQDPGEPGGPDGPKKPNRPTKKWEGLMPGFDKNILQLHSMQMKQQRASVKVHQGGNRYMNLL